jgi:hypothetical protein
MAIGTIAVQSSAIDFCDVKILCDTTCKLVENFVAHLADWAEKGPKCSVSSAAIPPRKKVPHEPPVTGLPAADRSAPEQLPDGVFLVRAQRVQFRRQAQKLYYTVALAILEPSRFSGHLLSSRLHCTPKALWKLNWFLRDFGYDTELLGRDEVDETQLVGLKGVVKISHSIFNGASLLRLDGFTRATVGRNSRRQIRITRRWA